MIIEGLLSRTIQMSTPLIIGALAEVLVERAGVMNIAIEGIFLLGAWAGFVGTYCTGSQIVGLIAAIVIGMLVGLCYGYITVKLKQHQIVTGTAINILAAGLALYFYRVLFGVPLLPLTVEPLARLNIPLLSSIPVIGEILFRQNILTYMAFVVVFVLHWLLFKTKSGLIIRSTGANPEAVDAAGINVDTVRFKAVLCSSALCGLAGAFYSMGFLGLFTEDIIGGRGWIAFAICFLGNWNPIGAAIGGLIFGLADATSIVIQTSGFKLIPNEFIIAIPYILTIVATISRKEFRVPEYLGIPYIKEGGR
ncbi:MULTISPECIES: ABC transporter permease [Acetomicrobium]|uniref:ABC transporter permease n=1 Tax=Acetomicrobium TaxID=49894 RepID=UPI0026F1BC69|nr:ABC transporter permease [Acetomicrobium mobile]